MEKKPYSLGLFHTRQQPSTDTTWARTAKLHTADGEEFRRETAEFGETVLYLKMGTRGCDKLDSRWETGVRMGAKDNANECIIGTTEGAVKARDFKRIAERERRWDAELIKSLKGTPW